jgi:VanZ family protein
VPRILARLGWLVWAWLPVVLWMAAILWMSGRSDLPMRTNPQTGETIKTTFTAAKLAHVFEYSVLALLMLRALVGARGGLGLPLAAAIPVTVVVAAVFGGLDEVRQSFVPAREPRLTDVALDAASALVASLAVIGWRRFRQRRAAAASSTVTAPASAPATTGARGSSTGPAPRSPDQRASSFPPRTGRPATRGAVVHRGESVGG